MLTIAPVWTRAGNNTPEGTVLSSERTSSCLQLAALPGHLQQLQGRAARSAGDPPHHHPITDGVFPTAAAATGCAFTGDLPSAGHCRRPRSGAGRRAQPEHARGAAGHRGCATRSRHCLWAPGTVPPGAGQCCALGAAGTAMVGKSCPAEWGGEPGGKWSGSGVAELDVLARGPHPSSAPWSPRSGSVTPTGPPCQSTPFPPPQPQPLSWDRLGDNKAGKGVPKPPSPPGPTSRAWVVCAATATHCDSVPCSPPGFGRQEFL